MANQVLIMVKTTDAWIKLLEHNYDQSLMLMKSSADLEATAEKQSLTPGEVLPKQELLRDLMMELGMPEEALEAYEINLRIRPNRFNSVYGAALSAKTVNNIEKATLYSGKLLELNKAKDIERSEILGAKLFLRHLICY